ncbi:MAG: hypothetical protein PHX88_10350 [Methanoculleus horonobensis]|jgi:hypothetical protein|nr:hypothetical protein [Methanoculleus horonobensis]MDD4253262.1 hypothetical protein [Methanoculleus horonobensis]
MEINDLMGEILRQSTSEGHFTLDELLHYSRSNPLTGIGVSKAQEQTFFLFLAGGEPDGAMYVDPMGTLFGDSAALRLTGEEEFELFLVAPSIVDALVSRCRVFDKSHLKKNGRLDIPTVDTSARQRIGVLSLIVRDGRMPLAGAHVAIRKGKLVMTSDVTDSAGKVSFRLLNGRYMCVVSDRIGERARRIVEFHKPQVVEYIEIGGTEDEFRRR